MREKRRFIALLAVAAAACLLAAGVLSGCGSKSGGSGNAGDSGNTGTAVGGGGGGNGKEGNGGGNDSTSESKDVNAGDEFTVQLESNASTGYAWTITTLPDSGILQNIGEGYQEPEQVMPGAPGVQVFTFQALAPGQTAMVLSYARSFEPDQPPAKTHTVSVTVH